MPPIKMYTTASCPLCSRAKRVLQSKGVQHIEEVRIDLDQMALKEMLDSTRRRTVPQIFIGTVHVGGYSDLEALDARGELTPLLQNA